MNLLVITEVGNHKLIICLDIINVYHFVLEVPTIEVPENESSYSQERAWRDILSVMDNLKIEKAHIVGLSMGGFATLHLGINAQDRVLSLVIAGCGYGAIPIDKTNFNKEADFSNISLDSAKIILNEGMDKFGSEYA